jgi:hypothetical protein
MLPKSMLLSTNERSSAGAAAACGHANKTKANSAKLLNKFEGDKRTTLFKVGVFIDPPFKYPAPR